MKQNNENKFYQSLKNIFTGANIEGESGYINLLKIKASYYKKMLEQFKKDVDAEKLLQDENFREEFFERLFSFFEKYFSESGSVYFVKTANWQRVYEKVYTDNRDVVLFWKTHMLYYVKSDILFQSMNVGIEDEDTGNTHKFFFNVGELKSKQNNEKKELIFTYTKTSEGTHNFAVSYSKNGNKTKTSDIAKLIKISEEVLQKACNTFKKQSEVDFFINKNAEKFLGEQLDLYLHQILLEEKNIFEQVRLHQLKTVKHFAIKIIQFISQFEDELVRVWNKPKFALNSNYVVTLDKLSDEIIKKITKHKNLPMQIKEWQELGMVEENFELSKKTDKEKYLPIDTSYFKNLEIEIVSSFDNIDEALDGRLIHSENYQALNTLQEKYKEKVQCIYIDPPFNTGNDFDYMDNYQDSTWLSLMHDRIEIARKFLRDDGSFYLHLDYRANYLGRFILQNIFGNNNLLNEIIYGYRIQGIKRNAYANKHDSIFLFTKKNPEENIHIFYTEKEIQTYTKPFIDTQLIEADLTQLSEKDIQIITKNIVNKQALNDKYKNFLFNRYFSETFVRDIWDHDETKPLISGSSEYLQFKTQKSEGLIKRIIKNSSDTNSLILDFFTGSATTIATAHKLDRKWLGVEMGEHFGSIVIPRIKTVLFGAISGISTKLEKEGKLKKGGLFKYYSLEQYEDTLRNMTYDVENQDIFNQKNAFEEYIFYADKKFAHVMDLQKDKLKVDFDTLYKNIDFPETISNILGLPIKQITDTTVVLEGRDNPIRYDYKNMTNDEKLDFVRLLQPLLWWGK